MTTRSTIFHLLSARVRLQLGLAAEEQNARVTLESLCRAVVAGRKI